MKKLKKKKVTAATLVLHTEQAMIGTLNQYARTRHELNRLVAAHEAEVAALQAAFDEDENIVQLRAEMAVLESSVGLFATNHRVQLFPEEKKSREYQVGTIGFRTDPPSVGLLLPKDTVGAVCDRLEETDWGADFVGYEPKLQKAAILRERANLAEDQLKSVGLKIVQDEKFFIDLHSDALERIAKPVEAAAA